MSAGPMTVELFLVFATTVFLLHKYGNWRRQHLIVSASVLIGWFFAFIIVFILPLDVALTFYRDCIRQHKVIATSSPISVSSTPSTQHINVTHEDYQYSGVAQDYERPPRAAVPQKSEDESNGSAASPSSSTVGSQPFSTSTAAPGHYCEQPGSFVPAYVLIDLWRVVYWTSQALTWLILPMMQSYSHAGEFTALGKIRRALYENALYYGSYLLILSLLLVYAAIKGIDLSIENIKTIAITASNTWGLFLLVLLLGYGLVEVPRQFWNSGTKGTRLQKTYFEIEKLSASRNDAEESVREVYKDTQAVLEAIRSGHPFRDKAEAIMAKFPLEITSQLNRRPSRTGGGESNFRDTDAANLTATSEQSLVRLHKRVIDSLQSHHRTQAQWKALVNDALHLEEVVKNESAPPGASREFVRSYPLQRSTVSQTICTPSIEWYWECKIKRPLLKVISVLMACMTVFIVWSECTFFVPTPVLSLAARFVNLAARNYDYGYIQISSILVISYLCVCAYYTVFKLKIYRYYHLDPHHETDENSLIFSAMLLCRLTPPLCLNFLGMIHLDSHVAGGGNSETAFTSIMGHMDVIPVVHRGFNIYFPILILLLCLGTYFRLGTRLLHQIGIDQFVGDDDMTHEMVQGGKALVQTERNKIQREQNREYRRGYLENNKRGDSTQPLRRNNDARESKGRDFSAGYGAGREDYSDTSPIVPQMETDPGSNYHQYRDDDDDDSTTRLDSYSNQQAHWSRASPSNNQGSPQKGIFDDL